MPSEEFYKKNSIGPEGLGRDAVAIVHHVMNAKVEPTVVSVVALDDRDETALLALVAGLIGGFDTSRACGTAGSADGHGVLLGDAAGFADLGLSI